VERAPRSLGAIVVPHSPAGSLRPGRNEKALGFGTLTGQTTGQPQSFQLTSAVDRRTAVAAAAIEALLCATGCDELEVRGTARASQPREHAPQVLSGALT